MKLVLSFDERTASSTLQQVISATGNNATINIGSAHALNPAELLRLAEVAGNDKRLSTSFNGAQLAGDGLHQFIAASGANTRCSVNTAQSTAIPVLLDAINLAGWTKNLSVDFNGAQLVSDNLQRALIAAGMNTSISVNTAQASNIDVILHVLGIAGDAKKFGASFNGAQLVGNNLQQAITASGASSRITLNTTQSVAIDILLQLLNLAGNSKQLSMQFNGAQLVADNLQRAAAAAGRNAGINVNTAQAASIGTLLQVLGIVANEKSFDVDFNGAQLQSDNLQRVLAAAGTKTSVSVNTAQAVGIDTLVQILGIAGHTKSFSAEFNGVQLVADNLQRAVRASGANVTIGVSAAQAVPVSILLDILGAAG